MLPKEHTVVYFNIFCSMYLDMGVMTASKVSGESSEVWLALSGGMILMDNHDLD